MRELQIAVAALAIMVVGALATAGHGAAPATGMVSANFNVSLAAVSAMSIDVRLSNQTIFLGEVEDMTVYAKNIGSLDSQPTQIRLTVYRFNGTELIQRAAYTDSLLNYYPGFERFFGSVFVPTETGIYFTKGNISFGGTTYDAWNVFFVFLQSEGAPGPSAPSTVVGGGGGGGGGAVEANRTTIRRVTLFPSMNLTYPRLVRVGQGDSTGFSIIIENTGAVGLRDVRLFTSTSNRISADINPKFVPLIYPGDDLFGRYESVFIASISVPRETPPGEYPFEFRVVSDVTEATGRMTIHVLPEGALSLDDIRQRILSYEIIILDIERQMLAAREGGIDTSEAEASLAAAKLELVAARDLFNQGKFDESREKLDGVKRGLERATLQLATATFFVHYKSVPYHYLGLAAGLAAAGGIGYYFYRAGKRRPRLIRGTEPPKEEED